VRELLVGQVKQRYVEYIYMEIMERIDMFKLIFISFVVLIVASAPESTIAQESSKMEVKYIFWNPPKYSVDGIKFDSTMGIFATNFKTGFLHLFDENEEEYRLVKRARTKINIGNWLMAVPAGICLGIALAKDSDSTPLLIAGSVLAVGDIVIGFSAYRDLSEAVDKRNTRLAPAVSIGF